MPGEEARQLAAVAARDRLFLAPPVEPAPPPPSASTLAAANRAALAGYRRDFAARVRAGACPACGERLCPRAGGRDAACVPA